MVRATAHGHRCGKANFPAACVGLTPQRGMQVITLAPLTRRNRFILAVSLGLGLGVTIVPGASLEAVAGGHG